MNEEAAERCALCERPERELTEHHLIPRCRHSKPRMLRRYSRQEMRKLRIRICRPCHDHLHRVLSEQELGETYASLDQLRAHPDIARFIAWIRNKPAGWRPPR